MVPNSVVMATPSAGKPPCLTDSSPHGLRTFVDAAELYYIIKDIKVDKTKIMLLGAGLAGFLELANWYSASSALHLAKTYDKFVADLYVRALPRNYVWHTKGAIKSSKQGEEDYGTWVDKLRTQQLMLTEQVFPVREFLETLLYNMDDELSEVLRHGAILKNTGFHEDDMAAIAFGTSSSLILTSTPDYERFDREARDEWARIAARRRSNASQIKSLSRKTTSLTVNSPSNSRSSGSRPSSNNTGDSSKEDKTKSNTTATLAKLTDRERDWLSATKGCFKCRLPDQQHDRNSCPNGFPRPGHLVAIPAGWKAGDPVPTVVSAPPAVGVRALHLASDSEEELPESLADDSDTDGYALPPLSLCVGNLQRRSRPVLSLADSGANSSIISDKFASELGLKRGKLSRPRRAAVAIEGESGPFFVTEFVRVPVELENGKWSAPTSTFLIAPLEAPFDLILGVPFMKQHRIDIITTPEIRILVNHADGRVQDLLEDDDSEGPDFSTDAPTEAPPISNEARACAIQLAESAQELVGEEAEMQQLSKRLVDEFDDLFPDSLPALTPEALEKVKTRHHIRLVDETKTHNQRGFAIPRSWREPMKRMLQQHLDSGRLRPSTSPYASAAFVVPKRDRTVDPRWVNDYRSINSNTVKDRTPLPLTDVVLGDAARARFWGKIDMTNAFFQTPMHEADIEKTAIKTPWGLFEWTVMPQGLCNAPATHQARVNEALRHLIGVCCEAFVDDIIIYSNTIEEHEKNCRAVLSALRDAGLYCSRKKTDLFTTRTEFLGHIISRDGLEADPNKTDKIKNWPRPRTVSQVRGFLGIVQYLRKFIPELAKHTSVLTPLTKKGVTGIEALWGKKEEAAFEAIKSIVTSLPVLKPLDQDSDVPIWLMTDASKVGVGAVLLQGNEWQTAHPCGFYSRQYIPAEKNYPTHEQELLAIIAALKAWRVELLGVRFRILTDHDTLKHFQTQATLSKRQSRWTETLADYDYSLTYVPGKQNAVADALSRFSFPSDHDTAAVTVCGISTVSLSTHFLKQIKSAYDGDAFCSQVLNNLDSTQEFTLGDDGVLWFEGNRLVIPDVKEIKEALLHDSHDSLGHFGARKTQAALAASFYWPHLAKDVERYVRSCDGCQRNKARTTRRAGRLHSLPVPSRPFTDISLDFVGPLPTSEGRDMLLTITDRLTGYSRLVACRAKDGAKDIADLVFKEWFRLFGLPERIVSDRDKLFTSRFWRSLHTRLGIKTQMSTSFHPETDGRSERTNKTAIQALRHHVSRHQKDWVSHLPLVEFAINAAVNDSTGKTPFDLVIGITPSLSPATNTTPSPLPAAEALAAERAAHLQEARDNLAAAKVRQAEQANKKRGDSPAFAVDDLVMVDSSDRRSRYKTRNGDVRAAKLFPRWDGPYRILEAWPATSTFRLALPPDDRAHPIFHSSKLKPYTPNDPALHPAREPARPEPIDIDGENEYEVEAIVDEKGRGRTKRYLVKWRGYPTDENTWEPLANVEDTEALDAWERREI